MGEVALSEHKVEIVKKYMLRLNRDQYHRFLNKCLRLAGVKYGRLQLVGMGLSILFNKRFNIFSDGNKTMVCSELVYFLIKDILRIPLYFKPEVDGPKELDKQLEKLYNSYIFEKIKG